MNREEYIVALVFCYKVETAGAIAGEVAMLLREDPAEKHKLDVFRRLEASNKYLCAKALYREGFARPTVEASFYRNAFKLGQKLGNGSWDTFLDHFEATIHPEEFNKYLVDSHGNEIAHEYEGVDLDLLRHLVSHELSLVEFIRAERLGCCQESSRSMEDVLRGKMCSGLVGLGAPVGW